jgi:hypothetical protein
MNKKLEFPAFLGLALILGVLTSLMIGTPEKAVSKKAATAAPKPDPDFMGYVARGQSNLVSLRETATNALERAAWLAIENRYTNIDWFSVAAALRHSSNTITSTNKP